MNKPPTSVENHTPTVRDRNRSVLEEEKTRVFLCGNLNPLLDPLGLTRVEHYELM